MLLQVTLSNIFSFENEVTFSMVSAKSEDQHSDHLVHHPFKKYPPLLPVAAIYGANAAGKSNLIKAIAFAQDLITEGTKINQKIPVPVFKLSNKGHSPSKLEFVFSCQGVTYSYGFVLDSKKIFDEWLYAIKPNSRKEFCLFERVTKDDNSVDLQTGSTLRGRSKRQEEFLQFIARGTRSNQLFLTEAVNRNVHLLEPVFKWFSDVLVIIRPEARYVGLEIGIVSSEKFANFLNGFLRSAGTGIDSFVAYPTDDIENSLPNMPDSMRLELVQLIEDAPEESVLILEDQSGKKFLLRKGKDRIPQLMNVKINHRHEDGSLIEFSVDEESDGTQRLIDLIPALFILQQDAEKVFFIDELDRCLHPLLSRQFLKYSLECRNGDNRHSQLIFTTHDTNLLDADILRRDEVWLVEKDSRGASVIYSLVEFEITSTQLQKGYLNGRFGAIPFLGNLHSLGWMPSEDE
jgi:AAA15 family ATPase/GTPase